MSGTSSVNRIISDKEEDIFHVNSENEDELPAQMVNDYSIDYAISYIGAGYFQYRLLFFTGCLWAADAMEIMIITFLVPILKKEWSLNRPIDGLIGSIVFSGMIIGSIFWSIIADKYGRRRIVIACTLTSAIFGTLSGLAPNIYLLFCATFIVGFTIGGSNVSYTLFAEYAPKETRGRLLIIEQSFWSFGALFSVVLAWLTLTYLNWHWYLIFCSIPQWIISMFFKCIPESALWLLATGKVAEAEAALEKLARLNGKSLPKGKLRVTHSVPIIDDSYYRLENEMPKDFHIKRKSYFQGLIKDVFSAEYRSTSILLYITMFMTVFGYYGISFISNIFFQKTSIATADNDRYWEMTITTASELPAIFAGIFLLDYIGRKRTMYYSFAIFSVSCFLLVIPSIQESQVGGILCVFFGRMNISLAFSTIFVYFSEFYPTGIRSTALGCATSLGRMAGIVTSFVSADMALDNAMILYGSAGFIAFLCCYMLKIDTKGKNLSSDFQTTDIEMNSLENKLKVTKQ